MTLQNDDFFWFAVSPWGTHLMSFSTFLVCFTCWTTTERSMLSSLATSCVVVRGSASRIALSWSLSTYNGWPLQSSTSRLFPLWNLLNYHCTIHSLAVLGSNALLMLWVVSAALQPTLMAGSKEELKSLLMKGKEESEKAGLRLNIQNTKIMASGPITSWQIGGETMETVTDYFPELQSHCGRWMQPWSYKKHAAWKKSYDKPRQHIKKQRHYSANKGPYSWSHGLTRHTSHVQMWAGP